DALDVERGSGRGHLGRDRRPAGSASALLGARRRQVIAKASLRDLFLPWKVRRNDPAAFIVIIWNAAPLVAITSCLNCSRSRAACARDRPIRHSSPPSPVSRLLRST